MDINEAPDVVTPAADWPMPPPPRDDATNPFIGRFGLRAIWGILIFIALMVAVSFAIKRSDTQPSDPSQPGRTGSRPA